MHQEYVGLLIVITFGLYQTISYYRGDIRVKVNAISAFTWSAEVFSIPLCATYFLRRRYDVFPQQLYMSFVFARRQNEHNTQFDIADSLPMEQRKDQFMQMGWPVQVLQLLCRTSRQQVTWCVPRLTLLWFLWAFYNAVVGT